MNCQKLKLLLNARYYDKLYDIEYPEEMKRIKENRRKLAEQAEAVQLSNTTLSKEELLAIRERSLKLKAIALKRGLEAIQSSFIYKEQWQ